MIDYYKESFSTALINYKMHQAERNSFRRVRKLQVNPDIVQKLQMTD